METTSMTSTFIAASADEVKERFQWKKGIAKMMVRSWY
jgi:hypothetical protein